MAARRISRRALVGGAAAASLATFALPARAAPSPTSPVALGRCPTYEPGDVATCLSRLLEQLGGISTLVAGKTVAIKVNVSGGTVDQFSRRCHPPALAR